MNSPADAIDAAIIHRVAQGDTAAFRQVYEAFSGPLFSLALRMLEQPEEAEDLTQEVFVKLWKDASSYDARRAVPLAWAITITRNKAIDRIRARGRRSRLLHAAESEFQNAPPPETPGPAQQAETEETAATVQHAIRRLPDDLRQTVEMAYFQGLSQTEIARALNEPLTTVKSRARRAMASLRQALKGGS